MRIFFFKFSQNFLSKARLKNVRIDNHFKTCFVSVRMACSSCTVDLGYYACELHCVVAVSHTTDIIAGSLESANSSILAVRNLFKDFGGEKIRIL